MSKHVLCHPYTNKVIAESQEGETLNVFIERLIKEEANLGGANLEKANLGGANLFSVRGNNKQIKSLHIFEEYDVAYTKEFLQIGCENHAIEDWKSFDNQRILKMDGKKALSFWRKYKELIFSTIETSPAT